jgi:hypothetical protein
MNPSRASLKILSVILLVALVAGAAFYFKSERSSSPVDVLPANRAGLTPAVTARKTDFGTISEPAPKLEGIPVVEAPPAPKFPTTLPPMKSEGAFRVVSSAKDQPIPGAQPALKPDPPAAPLKKPSTEKEMRLQELLDEVAAEKDPHIAQRTQLTIGGYIVGNEDWAAAKQLYETLAASPYVEVRSTALRNLAVVNRNLALESEKDMSRREWLQLDLALLHQSYGHEKTAKTMFRSLQANSMQEAVRQQAAQRLATYVIPPLPTLPEPTTGGKP